ncbi:MAG: putative sugar O-methyltransferase [Nitrospina sp.]|nr:putative sugar O-methyltransferase [Nitrospina sp.]
MSAIKNLAKWLLSLRLLEKIGLSLVNVDMLKCVNHYFWIFKLPAFPKLEITYREKIEITDEDIHLCERLIKAYKLVSLEKTRTENKTSALWAGGLREKYGKLSSVLESGDPKILASTLSSMFREQFVYGLAYGDLFKHSTSTLGNKIWSLKYRDDLIALAEYLGVVRNESPQQGRIAPTLNENLDSLVKNIESHLKISMNFPDVGAPYGILANGSLIAMEHPEHIYAALRLHHAITNYLDEDNNKKLHLVEIGGGYGGLGHWIRALGRTPLQSYTIIDLPMVNVLQGYFLSKAFHPSDVCFFGESPTTETLYHVLPTISFESISHSVDILINENSMPEMTDQIVEGYIRTAKDKVTGMFFSYNHEAFATASGVHHVLVSEIVNRVGGFERMARNVSWVRNGYVEETYIKKN